MARALSPQTLDALRVLGSLLAAARRQQRRTLADVAERVGVSVTTLRKVEAGDPGVAIGTAFEVAAILSVPLFGADGPRLAELAASGQRELALLPARIRRPAAEPDDDF
jgi:transcriptional regulator with XRE-family HTH domain